MEKLQQIFALVNPHKNFHVGVYVSIHPGASASDYLMSAHIFLETSSYGDTMFQYEPVLQPGNEHYIHHMLLYECVAPHEFVSLDSMFQRYVEHPGEFCYSTAMPTEWDHCMTAIVAWAVGSEGKVLAYRHMLLVFRSCIHSKM